VGVPRTTTPAGTLVTPIHNNGNFTQFLTNNSINSYKEIMDKVFGNGAAIFSEQRNEDYQNLMNQLKAQQDAVEKYAEENRRDYVDG
ncbi:hypothetical protein FO519_000385, partial [Halicephalobus sp. NKZ332]